MAAAAFGNNTANLYSSDFIRNTASKTNYNYLRLLSEKNTKCTNNRFTNYSGTVVLSKPIEKKKCTSDNNNSNNNNNTTLSKLANIRSYNLLHSINNGFYLPTVINNFGNLQIHRPPYTYNPKCNDACIDNSGEYIDCCTINTGGDLQDVLHHEYLDFGSLSVITNIATKNITSSNELTFDSIQTEIGPNSVMSTDIAINDFIIDPDNLFSSFRDCNLITFLNLQKHSSTVTISTSNDPTSTEVKLVQWKKFNLQQFPNNKYKRFDINTPIYFYTYKECTDEPTFSHNNYENVEFIQEVGLPSDSQIYNPIVATPQEQS